MPTAATVDVTLVLIAAFSILAALAAALGDPGCK